MRFTKGTGFKVRPFDLHHGRYPTTELTNIVKKNKSCFPEWIILNVPVAL